MILDYETIIKKIVDSASVSRIEVEEKIKKKLSDLQDLISKEGAAHIIANELNVKLFDTISTKNLKINQIQVGINSINLVGKVVTVYDVKSFQKNDKQGRIGSMLVGDETGTIRVVIWDENLISLMKDIKEGNIIKINNSYSKQNNNGFKELHLGNRSQIILSPENETIGEIKIGSSMKKKVISELTEEGNVEVLGTIVQIFEPKYYNSCPVCNKKVMPQEDTFNCQEHGKVQPKPTPILNIYLDDGTGNIRAVLFRDQASKIINGKTLFEEIKKENLGKQLILRGKVTNNTMFSRFELVVNSIEEPKPEEILAELEKKHDV